MREHLIKLAMQKIALSGETLISAALKTKGTARANKFMEHAIEKGDNSFKGTLTTADKTKGEVAGNISKANENLQKSDDA